jgi:hypothetical protein
MSSDDAAFAAEWTQQTIAAAIERMAPMDGSTQSTPGYLSGSVYPTLVPAMEALLREVQVCHDEGREPPQALDWIASYLMRHNPATIPAAVPGDAEPMA